MALEQLLQHCPRSLLVAFNCMNTSQVQVGLVKIRSNSNRLFETRDRLVTAVRSQVENPKIVQSFGIARTARSAACSKSNARDVSSS